MKITDQLTSYLAAFVDELVQAGVTEVVISPGSRSTPIAMLLAEHPSMNTYLNIDERSAAFFALGIAKASRKPVALICTSGTATANYYPAIIEAHYSRVPLIVMTADRPHELREVGAPQAIDQIHLYGKYSKLFIEMAIPENNQGMIHYAKTMAAKAVSAATSAPNGPVHLNFPLREPLVPNLEKEDLWNTSYNGKSTYVSIANGKPILNQAYFQSLYSDLKNIENGLIICGPIEKQEFASAVVALSEKLNYPILADPLSQLRSGSHSKANIIECYDTTLRNEQINMLAQPEVVIRFGAMPVSKALMIFLKNASTCRQLIVDGDGGWREPTLSSSEMVYCDEIYFCQSLAAMVKEDSKTEWLNHWVMVNSKVRDILVSSIQDDSTLLEGKVFSELGYILPEQTLLFVGNSMPIRDLDTYFTCNDKSIRMMANRGANGIDGIVSTALGASVSQTPLVLVIGDLSFYHDLNGLLAAKLHKLNATIIVINNDGGGIFSFLPQAEYKTHFESLFGTPIGLDFEHVVNMYHGTFDRVENWSAFREKVYQGIQSDGLNVIEIQTIRTENVKHHRNLWKNVSQEINSYFVKD